MVINLSTEKIKGTGGGGAVIIRVFLRLVPVLYTIQFLGNRYVQLLGVAIPPVTQNQLQPSRVFRNIFDAEFDGSRLSWCQPDRRDVMDRGVFL